MNNEQGCGKNIDGWNRCGVMEMGSGLVFCKDCQPTIKLPLDEQVRTLTNDIAILKKAMGSAFVAIEKDSDMDKASSLLTRALADTEDFK